jgi:DNA-binding NtrC family response regulator
MAANTKVLVLGLKGDDLEMLSRVCGGRGTELRSCGTPGEFARCAVAGRATAVVLGLGKKSIANLDVIQVIHAVKPQLPVIVIGEEDSLELERSARQKNIFYYLVHPIARAEVEAVWKDVERYSRDMH